MSLLAVYLLSIIIPIFETDPVGLGIGDKAPAFTAIDQNGDQVSLYSELEEGKVVLTFYRGAWCRYCMKQLKDYQDSLSLLQDAGATLIAVSAEHEEGIQKAVEISGASYSLIRDPDQKIMLDYQVVSSEKAEEFRIKSKKTEKDISSRYVPVPALYIISQEGIIEFVSFNPDYKVRMTVREILKQL